MPDAAVARSSETANSGTTQQVDVAVVGAGFAGLYLLHRLRKAGFSAVVIEEAGDVGGTWYWNRYPGARCDIQTIDYSYTFDPELESAGNGRENTNATRILQYLGFALPDTSAPRHQLCTKVTAAIGTRPRNAGSSRRTMAPVFLPSHIMATAASPRQNRRRSRRQGRQGEIFHRRWQHEEVISPAAHSRPGTGSSESSDPLLAGGEHPPFSSAPDFACPPHGAARGPPGDSRATAPPTGTGALVARRRPYPNRWR